MVEGVKVKTWAEALAYSNGSEIWHCQRALNQRQPLTVIVCGRKRFRADSRKQATKAELVTDGWELWHRHMDKTIAGS